LFVIQIKKGKLDIAVRRPFGEAHGDMGIFVIGISLFGF